MNNEKLNNTKIVGGSNMARKPFEEVMGNVNKWAAPEVTLRSYVVVEHGYPVMLKNPQYIIGRMSKDLTSRQIDELLSIYTAAKTNRKYIDDDIAMLMEKYREEKYDQSCKVFNIVAVLKYSDGTGECYGLNLQAEVLKLDKKEFKEEVIKPNVAKIVQNIGKEADYWDVTNYIIICHQI